MVRRCVSWDLHFEDLLPRDGDGSLRLGSPAARGSGKKGNPRCGSRKILQKPRRGSVTSRGGAATEGGSRGPGLLHPVSPLRCFASPGDPTNTASPDDQTAGGGTSSSVSTTSSAGGQGTGLHWEVGWPVLPRPPPGPSCAPASQERSHRHTARDSDQEAGLLALVTHRLALPLPPLPDGGFETHGAI